MRDSAAVERCDGVGLQFDAEHLTRREAVAYDVNIVVGLLQVHRANKHDSVFHLLIGNARSVERAGVRNPTRSVAPVPGRSHAQQQSQLFVARAHNLEDLVSLGTLNAQAAAFLRSAVIAGLNLVVSGGTQAGNPSIR